MISILKIRKVEHRPKKSSEFRSSSASRIILERRRCEFHVADFFLFKVELSLYLPNERILYNDASLRILDTQPIPRSIIDHRVWLLSTHIVTGDDHVQLRQPPKIIEFV